MYQTAWVKVSLSPQVPLALSRHPLRSTSNLSLMHQGTFFLFVDGLFPEESSRAIKSTVLFRTDWTSGSERETIMRVCARA